MLAAVEQAKCFLFESYEFSRERGEIVLRYSLDGRMEFIERLILPKDGVRMVDEAVLDRALHTLHLFGGASYYKTCCPKEIQVHTIPLSEQQAQFWNTVYEKGLGEFFYRNKIDFRGLIDFPAKGEPRQAIASRGAAGKRILVPIGGGKDSTVTAELLKKAGYDVTLLRMGSHPLITETARTAGLPLLTVERHLSGVLFDLNAKGALNGHVPITGYLSALSVVIAMLYGFDAVAFSNEQSASEGNLEYLGTEVNHQWSKSLEFERMFQEYLAKYVTGDVAYFSFLRPWSELKIAEVFSRYPQYFPVTTSCNTNWRIVKERPKERWCGACPKCAFAFAVLAAWVPAKTLIETFGGNLFETFELLPTYGELLGTTGSKPFECVGTPEETRAAFLLARKQEEFRESAAMKMFDTEVADDISDGEALIAESLAPSDDHAVPPSYLHALA
jgi:hypothetical protein